MRPPAHFASLCPRRYHPDRGGDGELFLLVSEAADVLGNEERRKEYDLNRGIVREERRGRGGYHHQFDGRNGRPKVEVYGDFKMKVDEFGNMEIYV
jgi:curved DNA-binding protein CbpA